MNTSVIDPSLRERPQPALYMIWDPAAPHVAAPPTSAYDIVAVPSEEAATIRPIVELDGALADPAWNALVDRVLPDGLFVARLTTSDEVIGVVSAIHNPRGSRHYFPGGGAIGHLVVAVGHRGHGLGLRLVAAARDRLRAAGYRRIWLGVEETRLPAIVTYLRSGFVPFLHGPDPDLLGRRWRDVFHHLGRAADPASWPRDLSVSAIHERCLERI